MNEFNQSDFATLTHLDAEGRANMVHDQEMVIIRDKALPLFYLKRWLVSSIRRSQAGSTMLNCTGVFR